MKFLMHKLKISETAAIMCLAIGALFALFLVAGLLISTLIWPFESPARYASGLLMGTMLSEAKVVLLEKALERSADMQEGGARGYASLMAMLRYMMTIAVLLLVFFFRDVFGLVGAIIGILFLQAAAYVASAVINRRNMDA